LEIEIKPLTLFSMSEFIVSARKYRPQTFDTVVGQHAITSTLKNAIKTDHLAQAFLFCGSRGVGKTTSARILAKTINCFNRSENIEACDQCDSCQSFNTGNSLNVYELDAASNNSVDDIRNLIDQVRIAPQLGNYKVYIIDEVHMLSNAAFNAFLKTLEEPPKHAIFILATTEKHKIIPTILSRCQIFDFNRIKVKDISDHLGSIATKEGITAEPEALHLIAQKADGALRDALSIFDQIVTFVGTNLSYKSVIENLNILDYDYYFRIIESTQKEDIPSALLLLNDVYEKGFDGHNFIVGLADHYRNLLICKDTRTAKLLEVGESLEQRYIEQSKELDGHLILRALAVLSKTDVDYKASKNQRLLVEMALMQLCSLLQEQEKKKD
jgi:DNA polymerase-3 subunit gamma/tau